MATIVNERHQPPPRNVEGRQNCANLADPLTHLLQSDSLPKPVPASKFLGPEASAFQVKTMDTARHTPNEKVLDRCTLTLILADFKAAERDEILLPPFALELCAAPISCALRFFLAGFSDFRLEFR